VKNSPKPFVFEDGGEAKRYAPATQRNRDAIVKVLRDVLPERGRVLEIASGTGEHIVHFAANFREIHWQPSDCDAAGLASIAAWVSESGLTNIGPAVQINATAPRWPVERADAMLCINMVHIASWEATLGLFAGAARLLPRGAPLYLYGPFFEANVPAAESNEAFDASLKARDPAWGLRHLDDMVATGIEHGFTLEKRIAMPANNLSLVFRDTL
jgi:cyclopropane fatty-acyl-phospholipid synthase-like methyltransferase